MLVESLSSWRFFDFGPSWAGVMSWLESIAPMVGKHQNIPDGIVSLEGCPECTINVVTTMTRLQSESLYEIHRKFCDVHMVLEGVEGFLNTPPDGLIPDAPFHVEKDAGFLIPSSQPPPGKLTLTPGMFTLIFPWDAHMPLLTFDGKSVPLRKCIAKIPLDALSLQTSRVHK